MNLFEGIELDLDKTFVGKRGAKITAFIKKF